MINDYTGADDPMTEARELIESVFERDAEHQWKSDPVYGTFELSKSLVSSPPYAVLALAVRSLVQRQTRGLEFGLSTVPGDTVSSESPPRRPSVEELITALNDPRWLYRTSDGLADDLRTSPDVVEQMLNEYPELVRWLPAHDKKGHQLMVSNRIPPTARERLLRIRGYAAKRA